MGFVDNDDFDELISILERLMFAMLLCLIEQEMSLMLLMQIGGKSGESWNQMGRYPNLPSSYS